jgi:phenylpyruvate tautomerase PptA (4-oxalocrotonate tautomerase family)
MPLYEVNHSTNLTASQKADLASALTQLHSTRFSTPRMFVNVRFTDISALKETGDFYVGGRAHTPSHILAHVRTGPSRKTSEFNSLCKDVTAAWDEIVKPLPKVKRSAPDEDRSLYSVFVLGDIVAGMEAGFVVPEAGKDEEWLAENMGAFKARAEAGEEEFVELVKEVEDRGMLAGKKTAAQQLEEMMGWGESA